MNTFQMILGTRPYTNYNSIGSSDSEIFKTYLMGKINKCNNFEGCSLLKNALGMCIYTQTNTHTCSRYRQQLHTQE